jgi:ribonuclease HII
MVIAGVLGDEAEFKALGAKDSKALTPKQRERLEPRIKETAKEWHLIEISAADIDARREKMSLNEIEAMMIAELVEKFRHKPDRIVIDIPDPTVKRFLRRFKKYLCGHDDCELVLEHKADVNHPSVSAASILAKVERDRHIAEIEKKHGISVETGYSHDPRTIAFLKQAACDGKRPDFVRYSWDTAKKFFRHEKQKTLGNW